jgi:hypothetical protein
VATYSSIIEGLIDTVSPYLGRPDDVREAEGLLPLGADSITAQSLLRAFSGVA